MFTDRWPLEEEGVDVGGRFSRGISSVVMCDGRRTGHLGDDCVKPRRLLLNVLHSNRKGTVRVLSGLGAGLASVGGRVRTVLGRRTSSVLLPSTSIPLSGKTTGVLGLYVLRTQIVGDRITSARRMLLTVLGSGSGLTTAILRTGRIGCRRMFRRLSLRPSVDTNVKFARSSSSRRRVGRSHSSRKSNRHRRRTRATSEGPAGSAPILSGFNASVAGTTRRNHLSPIIKHRQRVRHLTRVLDHHGGGGPVLVNRPKIKGSTVIRNLTLHVVRGGISHVLFSGHIITLSVTTIITNAGCHKRFRRHVHSVLGRLRGGPGIVLFVSRVRAVMNTKSTTKSVSTTGVLGPTLTHKRVRYVNTAALSRCQGGVRGSKTLRHHFRGMVMRPAATSRALRVLHGVGSGCRSRRGMGCASTTLRTYIGLASHCVASHGFPSGTVSTLSRTNSHMRLAGIDMPGRVRSRRGLVRRTGGGGGRTIGSRGFRLTTDFHSGRGRLTIRLSIVGGS